MTQHATKIAPDGLIALLLALSDGGDPRVAALLAAHPLEVLARFDADALRAAGGLSSKQATRLAAAFELGREVERASRASTDRRRWRGCWRPRCEASRSRPSTRSSSTRATSSSRTSVSRSGR